MNYEFHEAANEFPLLDDKRLNELADDIEQNGLREPIYLYDNKILDGRNRYKACQLKNITPKYETLPSDIDPFSYVWSLNGERRDMSADQRYLIWKSCAEKSEWWQQKQQEMQKEANRKRAEAAKEQENRANQYTKPEKPQVDRVDHRAQVVPQPVASPAKKPERSSTAKAEASKTNRGAVERMDRLERDRPDLAQKVRRNEIKPAEALRRMKKDVVIEKSSALPEGKYRVIYADPPWKYNDQKDVSGAEGLGASNQYPTMPTSEICNLPVKELAAENCVLFCWATFPMLPDAIEVVKAWGFKYKTAFIWDKTRPTFGNYHKAQAELLIVATRGSATPESNQKENQIISIKRTKHSAKPEEFRNIISRMYPTGKKIELFARQKSEGWDVWGNEL